MVPSPLRSLPRFFIPGAELSGPFELPPQELHKIRNVLRLQSGAEIAVLPNDGTQWRCKLEGKSAVPICQETHAPMPQQEVTLWQALPKPDKLDEIIRLCTEVGVSHFKIFVSDRTVQRWDEGKVQKRLERLSCISQEASEVCGRGVLPTLEWVKGLEVALQQENVVVLHESERVSHTMAFSDPGSRHIVIGPEGGWSPRESELIGGRARTMGSLVFRVDTAALAASVLALELGS